MDLFGALTGGQHDSIGGITGSLQRGGKSLTVAIRTGGKSQGVRIFGLGRIGHGQAAVISARPEATRVAAHAARVVHQLKTEVYRCYTGAKHYRMRRIEGLGSLGGNHGTKCGPDL